MPKMTLASIVTIYMIAGILCPCLAATQPAIGVHAHDAAAHDHHAATSRICHDTSTNHACASALSSTQEAPIPDTRYADGGCDDIDDAVWAATPTAFLPVRRYFGLSPPIGHDVWVPQSPVLRGDVQLE